MSVIIPPRLPTSDSQLIGKFVTPPGTKHVMDFCSADCYFSNTKCSSLALEELVRRVEGELAQAGGGWGLGIGGASSWLTEHSSDKTDVRLSDFYGIIETLLWFTELYICISKSLISYFNMDVMEWVHAIMCYIKMNWDESATNLTHGWIVIPCLLQIHDKYQLNINLSMFG